MPEYIRMGERLNPQHNIAIIGMGAVGRLFFNELEKVKGISLAGIYRNTPLEVRETLINRVGFLILATPNPIDDLMDQVASGAPSRELIVVLPQNGIGAVEAAADRLQSKDVGIIRASLLTQVTKKEDGTISYDRLKRNIGLSTVKDTPREKLQQLSDIFIMAGFETTVFEDYRAMEWTKLFLNLIGSTGTVTGKSPRETFADKRLFELEMKAMADRLAILRRAGISLVRFPGIPLDSFKLLQIPYLMQLVGQSSYVRDKIGRQVANKRNNQPPGAVRLIKEGKPTEISYYYGPIIRLGKEYGRRSPVDQAILEIVKGHEEKKIDLNNLSPQDLVGLLFATVEKLS